MTDDAYKKLIEQMNRQLAPFSDIERNLGARGELARIVGDIERRSELARVAYGPIAELREFGALAEAANGMRAFQSLQDEIEVAHRRFNLPEIKTATSLLQDYSKTDAFRITEQFRPNVDALALAAGAMRAPWVDAVEQMRSVGAFAELQSIGWALQAMPTFEDQVTTMLRGELGDWRGQIAWPEAIFDNPFARSEFYAERGLDTALTAFPAAAFAQSLDIAGLRSAPPALIGVYDYEEVPEEGEREAAFERTNAAHDRLQRFETQIRSFIDQQMTMAFGEYWFKNRIPGDMRRNWIDKQEKARANGEPEHPLIAYADFTDYVPIITQRNNWNDVFSPFFDRQTSVQESFQRLYPIRICTMHSRMITQDDELFLLVETKRLLFAIQVRI